MAQADSLDSFIGTIYDAALDTMQRQPLLESLCRQFKATSALLFTPELRVGEGMYVDVGLSPAFLAEWEAHYFRHDLWTMELERRGIVRGQFTTDELLIPPSELINSEYYNDYLRPHGVFRHICNVLSDTDSGVTPLVFLGFYRPPGSEPFGRTELDLYAQLAPHLRRANDIYWQLRQADSRHQADLSVLDRLAHGVVLLDGAGDVLHLNAAASKAIAAGDGLRVEKRRLAAALPDQNAKLIRAIGEVCRTGNGQGYSAGGFLAIERPSGKRPWSLLVGPMPGRGPPGFGQQRPAGVVFIQDPESVPAGISGLARLYELTPAESRLAEALAQGRTLADIADGLGLSKETLRAQLRAVFGKTGTRRQAELVRLLAMLPLRPEPEGTDA